ncbi:hypothetical protein ACFO3D_10515 [Virgibacillus kekensis]|uniref:Spore coat protein YutH n=1 Tax=Virgibacillus kekensis TaxID=202261 RepID=A0ABV9DIS6_9BACI
MKELLSIHYGIHVDERIIWNGLEGFRYDNFFYFTTPLFHREIIHMEQSALAYYLHENGWPQTAIPIPNNEGNWYTRYREKDYLVFQVEYKSYNHSMPNGEALATFHDTGANYQYEPQMISSYGQWKHLWAEKLDAFEQRILTDIGDYPGSYYRLVHDTLPYLIGISENAIQYMQESEQETRFHKADQGAIAFRRYNGQLHNNVIMMTDFVYDHPVRDIAEYIRSRFLQEEDPQKEIASFLNDYQKIRSLSVFSWRVLYARLIFPAHIYDVIEQGFHEENKERCNTNLAELLNQQQRYEKRLAEFYNIAGTDYERMQIPVLHWL